VDPLLLLLLVLAVAAAVAAIALPSERGRPRDHRDDEALRLQLAAWR
jgi:hypothetical protein